MNRLEAYSRLVREGRGLDEAVAFARYVLFSGLCSLCDEQAQELPLKVDGAMLRWKAEDLQRDVTERYRLRDTAAHLQKSELETMHDKLDKIAGYLSRLSEAPAVAVNPIEHVSRSGTERTGQTQQAERTERTLQTEPTEQMQRNEVRFSVIPGGLGESYKPAGSSDGVTVNGDAADAQLKVSAAGK